MKAATDAMLLKNESIPTEVRGNRSEQFDTIENVTASRLKVNRTRNLLKESKLVQEAARELVAQSRKLRERTASIRSHSALSNISNCAKVKTKNALGYRQSDYPWSAISRRRDPTSVLINRE